MLVQTTSSTGRGELFESADHGGHWRSLGMLPGLLPMVYASSDPAVTTHGGWGPLYLVGLSQGQAARARCNILPRPIQVSAGSPLRRRPTPRRTAAPRWCRSSVPTSARPIRSLPQATRRRRTSRSGAHSATSGSGARRGEAGRGHTSCCQRAPSSRVLLVPWQPTHLGLAAGQTSPQQGGELETFLVPQTFRRRGAV